MSVAPALPDTWNRPAPTRAQLRNDVLLAAAFAAGFVLSAVLYGSVLPADRIAPTVTTVLVGLGLTAPLAIRRLLPEVAAVVVAASMACTQLLVVPDSVVSQITLFIALYSLGAWGRSRTRSIAVRWAIIGAMFLWVFSELLFRWSYPAGYEGLDDRGADGPLDPYLAVGLISIAINLLYFGAAYFFGDRAWAAARERAALEVRTAELVAERERSATQAVTLERVRIARELHDVVAHHVSVMGVQAGAARRILTSDPDRAVASLEAVEASARSAVDELRRMLGALRADGSGVPEDEGTGSGPSTWGVARLRELVDTAEGAGRPATLTVVGEPRPLPGTVDMVAFRVAQEAVTNTVKHAGAAARIDVRLRYLPDGIEIEIADTGAGTRGARPGQGLGQVGMRERVAAVGGSIELGPRARGGYLVRARLPTPPARPVHDDDPARVTA